jgi:ferrous iron transport protein B
MTTMMGFGCNAAGVIATRIIDSPRERLIAILTNNFALCNGRWPTQILIATLFIGSLVPAYLGGMVSALAVVSVALWGPLDLRERVGPLPNDPARAGLHFQS